VSGQLEVTVRLFAALREQAGARTRSVQLPEGSRAGDVWPALGLGDEPPGLAFAVNHAYTSRDTPLAAGDEVALIPPVSGGDERVHVELVAHEPDLAALHRAVADRAAGAVATFVGTVRESARGRDVEWLDYEVYDELALPEMARIAEAAVERNGCLRAAVVHRSGRAEIGEATVAIAVSSAHRHDALRACTEIIDTLKQRVPIWKKERYAGGEEWIGQGS
jgi:molybdopterin synthase catalytic subunit/molybdopterin converting factor small subunit